MFIHHAFRHVILPSSVNQELMGSKLVWQQMGSRELGSQPCPAALHRQDRGQSSATGPAQKQRLRLCGGMLIGAFGACLVQGGRKTQPDLEMFVCLPGDPDSRSPVPSAAASEQVVCQRTNIFCPFFVQVKKANTSC